MVIVSTNIKRLKRYLIDADQQCNYFYFGHKDSEIVKLLNRKSHREISIADYPENLREKLFMSYIDLIGHVGNDLNSLYWWASFTASKNRFMSRLLQNLSAFHVIHNKLKENPSSDILVISPPGEIIQALSQYSIRNAIQFKSDNDLMRNFFVQCKQKIEHFLRMVFFLFGYWSRIFYVKRNYKKNIRKSFNNKAYYVLRTWVYPPSIRKENHYSDSFFGRLPEFLSEQKKNVILLAGIINNYKDTVRKISKFKGKYLIIPLEYFLGYSDVIEVIYKTFSNRLKLKDRVKLCGLDVSGVVQAALDRDCRKFIRTDLLQYYVIKNMLKHITASTFITTYENNPWEKMCILSLKKKSPSTKIIGYQHAVVTKASANMFISEKEESIIPMPDKIITVGEVTKDVMEKFGHYPEGRIKPSCALRHEYIYALERKEFGKIQNILVGLEGVPECYKLVNFVFNALSDSREFHTIFRTHPERSFDKIKNDLSFDMGSQDNFTVSADMSLKEDLERADLLIYWGSTVSLEALMMGIPVIHVNLGDIMSVDPLSECPHLSWSVKKPEHLADAIAKISSLSDDEYVYQYSKAREYIGKYLRQVTDERLREFIV